jgi:hypothetical protein
MASGRGRKVRVSHPMRVVYARMGFYSIHSLGIFLGVESLVAEGGDIH